jgi:hypothetical protein
MGALRDAETGDLEEKCAEGEIDKGCLQTLH